MTKQKQYSFLGKTAQKALNKAIEELGDDAIIINTKKIKKHDTFVYEVTALAPENETNNNNDTFQNQYMKQKPQTEVINQDKQNVLPSNQNKETLKIKHLETQLHSITNTLELLQQQIFQQSHSNIIIPPEFRELSIFLKGISLSDELYEQIMKISISNFPLELKNKTSQMKTILAKILQKHIYIKEELPLEISKKKILLLTGPTGVGKTTTVAKLASKFMLEDNYKVGLITMDQYRIGAEEQLEKYSKILNCSFASISTSSELLPILKKMKHCDYIIIDTLGTSQFDTTKINQLSSFLQKHVKIPLETLLTIPSNINYQDMLDIHEQFKILKPSSIIATKMDETRYYGSLFSFLYKTKLPLQYLTIGQAVPEDLIKATRNTITTLLFDYKNLKKYKEHKKNSYKG
jgi:flagellar biosynthesis protein FlhF